MSRPSAFPNETVVRLQVAVPERTKSKLDELTEATGWTMAQVIAHVVRTAHVDQLTDPTTLNIRIPWGAAQ